MSKQNNLGQITFIIQTELFVLTQLFLFHYFLNKEYHEPYGLLIN